MRQQLTKSLAVGSPSHSVRPASPPAPYIGGKRNLSKRLCALIDATPHDTYVEPFVGMGGVFLKRARRPRAEVVNDISADVTTLFRILQRHYPQFMDVLKWQITSRAEFDRLRAAAPETLTDLERAARFLYLQRLSFGGKVDGRNFGVDRRTPARFDVTKLAPTRSIQGHGAATGSHFLPSAPGQATFECPSLVDCGTAALGIGTAALIRLPS